MSDYYCSEHGDDLDPRCVACEAAKEWADKDYRIAELEQAQRWIPVGEQLPRDRDLALVAVIMDGDSFTDMTRWDEGDGVWFDYPLHQVTHWMPLPEPPSSTDLVTKPPSEICNPNE